MINNETSDADLEKKAKQANESFSLLAKTHSRWGMDALSVYGVNIARVTIAQCFNEWKRRGKKRSIRSFAEITGIRHDKVAASLLFLKIAEVTPGNGWLYFQVSTEALYTNSTLWDSRIDKYARGVSCFGKIKE